MCERNVVFNRRGEEQSMRDEREDEEREVDLKKKKTWR